MYDKSPAWREVQALLAELVGMEVVMLDELGRRMTSRWVPPPNCENETALEVVGVAVTVRFTGRKLNQFNKDWIEN